MCVCVCVSVPASNWHLAAYNNTKVHKSDIRTVRLDSGYGFGTAFQVFSVR